jgi:isopenicillin N synthase-like dioxygenase
MSDVAEQVYEQAPAINTDEIPVVDISGFADGDDARRRAIAAEVAEACSTVGFLYMSGHGLSQTLIDDTFAQTERFFAQTEEDRRKTLATRPNGSGAMFPRNRAAWAPSAPCWNLPADDPGRPARQADACVRTIGPTTCQASARSSPPTRTRCSTFRSISAGCSPWASTCRRISSSRSTVRPLIQQSLLYYPAPPSADPKDLKIGAGEHSDTGAFTILMQDQVGGLEVKHREKGWVQATPIEGTFVVNIGDVMMNWTNGRYVSNLHRVVNRKAQARMSLPHFANADYDAIIAPIPALIEPGSDPITGPIHFGQYMDEFYKGQMDR